MRSGGGLQGLMWSKYGLENGKLSPLEKRRLERCGRRVNSEPFNDIEKAKEEYNMGKGRDRSCSESEVAGTATSPKIQIVNVMDKLTLDPKANLEAEASTSSSPRSPVHPKMPSPAHAQIMRNDSFDIFLSKRIQEEFRKKSIDEGQQQQQGSMVEGVSQEGTQDEG